jgi:hypothetical protein
MGQRLMADCFLASFYLHLSIPTPPLSRSLFPRTPALPLPARLLVPCNRWTAAVMAIAEADPNIIKWTEGKEIKKKIYVPGKICNIVVAG